MSDAANPPIRDIYRSAKKLHDDATEASERVLPALRQSYYHYYIARYLVSFFEARGGKLPVQVWNEYRNSLDHFMRHLYLTGENALQMDRQPNIVRMEGHLQRANLDICKILCTSTLDRIEAERARWSNDVFDFYDNGEFRSRIDLSLDKAERDLERAKINDLILGDNPEHNRTVVYEYLLAVFQYVDLLAELREAEPKLRGIRNKMGSQSALKVAVGIAIAVATGVAANFVYATVTKPANLPPAPLANPVSLPK